MSFFRRNKDSEKEREKAEREKEKEKERKRREATHPALRDQHRYYPANRGQQSSSAQQSSSSSSRPQPSSSTPIKAPPSAAELLRNPELGRSGSNRSAGSSRDQFSSARPQIPARNASSASKGVQRPPWRSDRTNNRQKTAKELTFLDSFFYPMGEEGMKKYDCDNLVHAEERAAALQWQKEVYQEEIRDLRKEKERLKRRAEEAEATIDEVVKASAEASKEETEKDDEKMQKLKWECERLRKESDEAKERLKKAESGARDDAVRVLSEKNKQLQARLDKANQRAVDEVARFEPALFKGGESFAQLHEQRRKDNYEKKIRLLQGDLSRMKEKLDAERERNAGRTDPYSDSHRLEKEKDELWQKLRAAERKNWGEQLMENEDEFEELYREYDFMVTRISCLDEENKQLKQEVKASKSGGTGDAASADAIKRLEDDYQHKLQIAEERLQKEQKIKLRGAENINRLQSEIRALQKEVKDAESHANVYKKELAHVVQAAHDDKESFTRDLEKEFLAANAVELQKVKDAATKKIDRYTCELRDVNAAHTRTQRKLSEFTQTSQQEKQELTLNFKRELDGLRSLAQGDPVDVARERKKREGVERDLAAEINLAQSLKTEVETLKSQHDIAVTRAAKFERKLREANEQYNNLCSQMVSTQEDFEKRLAEAEKARADAVRMAETKVKSPGQSEDFTNNVTKMMELLNEVNEQKAVVQRLRSEIERLTSDRQREIAAEIEAVKDATEDEIASLKARLQSTNNMLDAMQEDYNEACEAKMAAEQAREAMLDQQHQIVAEFKKQLTEKDKDIVDHINAYDRYVSENERLQAEVDHLKSARDERLDEYKAEVTEIDGYLAERNEQLSQAEKNNEYLQTRIDEFMKAGNWMAVAKHYLQRGIMAEGLEAEIQRLVEESRHRYSYEDVRDNIAMPSLSAEVDDSDEEILDEKLRPFREIREELEQMSSLDDAALDQLKEVNQSLFTGHPEFPVSSWRPRSPETLERLRMPLSGKSFVSHRSTQSQSTQHDDAASVALSEHSAILDESPQKKGKKGKKYRTRPNNRANDADYLPRDERERRRRAESMTDSETQTDLEDNTGNTKDSGVSGVNRKLSVIPEQVAQALSFAAGIKYFDIPPTDPVSPVLKKAKGKTSGTQLGVDDKDFGLAKHIKETAVNEILDRVRQQTALEEPEVKIKTVEKIVDRIVEKPVDRIVEVEKIVEVPVTVEKIVEVKVPVDRIVEKIVEKPTTITKEKIVEKIVNKETTERVYAPRSPFAAIIYVYIDLCISVLGAWYRNNPKGYNALKSSFSPWWQQFIFGPAETGTTYELLERGNSAASRQAKPTTSTPARRPGEEGPSHDHNVGRLMRNESGSYIRARQLTIRRPPFWSNFLMAIVFACLPSLFYFGYQYLSDVDAFLSTNGLLQNNWSTYTAGRGRGLQEFAGYGKYGAVLAQGPFIPDPNWSWATTIWEGMLRGGYLHGIRYEAAMKAVEGATLGNESWGYIMPG